MLHQSKHTPQRPLSEKQKDSTQVTSSSGGGGGGGAGGGTYTRSHRTCDWEDVLINKVLFRGKGEKMKQQKKKHVTMFTVRRPPGTCRDVREVFLFRLYNTTHFEKLAERDFHFLFGPRGGEGRGGGVESTSWLRTVYAHMSQKEQNGTPASV